MISKKEGGKYCSNKHKTVTISSCRHSNLECYIAEEAVEFCSDFVGHAEPVGIPKSRYADADDNTSNGVGTPTLMNNSDLMMAHRNVLENTASVLPYTE